jgi:hypothetical protein
MYVAISKNIKMGISGVHRMYGENRKLNYIANIHFG